MPGHQLVWFRNDLRLHDHRPLAAAAAAANRDGGSVIPVYVFDPRFCGPSPYGFDRAGRHRLHFLSESLRDLDHGLRRVGSRLLVRTGPAEIVLPEFADCMAISSLWFHTEFAPEETSIAKRVCDAIEKRGISCRPSTPCTLCDTEDLPFEIDDTPEVFSKFRRKIEKDGRPATSVATVIRLPALPEIVDTEFGDDISAKNEFLRPHDRNVETDPVAIKGGESEGLRRIEQYFWSRDCLRNYKQTRNGMLRFDDSSKLSPWLALGCLSPRMIHQEVMRYEEQRVKNESTYWLVFELLWRDFFALMVAKHGARVFQQSGLRGIDLPWSEDDGLFETWREGKTGFPLIDANMRELMQTGYMSNRGRQNVASFLTKNLGIDWRMGAAWFESCLIDFDPCSNYGNWNYIAGVGNDSREFRWFNTIKQAKQYDPQGEYVRHWLPELSLVDDDKIHSPWLMSDDQQRVSKVLIGQDYPLPIVDLFESADSNRRRFESSA